MKTLCCLLMVLLSLPALCQVQTQKEKNRPPDIRDVLLKNLACFNYDGIAKGETYKADAYLQMAATIQAMGKEKGSAFLSWLSRAPKRSYATFLLARMLFVSMRAPMLGAPEFLGQAEGEDWVQQPVAFVDGIPFVIVSGYLLAGLPETPKSYVSACIKEGKWNSFRFQPKSEKEKQEALKKLLASPKWKRPLNDSEKQILADQIK